MRPLVLPVPSTSRPWEDRVLDTRDTFTSPLPGKVLDVLVDAGDVLGVDAAMVGSDRPGSAPRLDTR